MGFNNPAISVIKCVGFNSVTASPALTAPVIRNLTESWERLSAQFCCSQSSCFSLNFFLETMSGFGTKGEFLPGITRADPPPELGEGFGMGTGAGTTIPQRGRNEDAKPCLK